MFIRLCARWKGGEVRLTNETDTTPELPELWSTGRDRHKELSRRIDQWQIVANTMKEASKAVSLGNKGKTSPTLERGGRRGLSENGRREGPSHAMSRCEECSKGSPGWRAPRPPPGQRGSVLLGVSQGDETAVF